MSSWWFLSGSECCGWHTVIGPFQVDRDGVPQPMPYQTCIFREFYNVCPNPSPLGSLTAVVPDVEVIPPPEIRDWLETPAIGDANVAGSYVHEEMLSGSDVDFSQDCDSISLDLLTSPHNQWLSSAVLASPSCSKIGPSSMLVSFSSGGNKFPVVRMPAMIVNPPRNSRGTGRDVTVGINRKVLIPLVEELAARDITVLKEYDDNSSYIRSKTVVSPDMLRAWAKKPSTGQASAVWLDIWATVLLKKEGSGYFLRVYVHSTIS